jgi:PiT family inorganic phosphate transporter
MPESLISNISLLFVLALILTAEFVNGWTDAPNAIATVVSTRVLKPKVAVVMASILSMLSAVRWGVARGVVTAWILTFPICGAIAFLFASIIQWITG